MTLKEENRSEESPAEEEPPDTPTRLAAVFGRGWGGGTPCHKATYGMLRVEEVKELLEGSIDKQTVQGVRLDMIERRIPAIEEQKGKPWQGSPTLGMRGSKSEGRLGSASAAESDAGGDQR